MKNYKNSDYALNKFSRGIVYKFADGIVEVTLEDYLRENPEKTAEDFEKLKDLSDAIYHEQVIQEHRTSRLNVSIHEMEEHLLAINTDLETEFIQRMEEGKALTAAHRLLQSGKLTLVQRRRFFLHFFKGLSTRQIAKLEGVNQKAVWESLMWAEKKLKKYF